MPDKPTRILVSLPCYGGLVYDQFLQSWTKLLSWCQKAGIALSLHIISNESLLPRARNMGIKKLLDHAEIFTHILFVDADMGFDPFRLQRLLAWDKPLVGCPGPAKHIHWELVGDALLAGKNPESFVLRYAVNFLSAGGVQAEEGYAKVKDFGCCFCLCKTEMVQELVAKYPETKCDSMCWVNGEQQDSANMYALFDTMICPEEGRYLECDHAFMGRWRRMGGDVWADLTSDLVHCGLYHFRGSMSEYFFQVPSFRGTNLPAIETPYGKLPDASPKENAGGKIPCDDHSAESVEQIPAVLP